MQVQLLKKEFDAEGIFRQRINRFVGIVDLDERHGGPGQKVHVHDPGRLSELLYPGNRVKLVRASRPGRKTAWTLMAARFDDQWVLVNSGLHRKISEAIINDASVSPFGELDKVDAEVRAGASRLDYRLVTTGGEIVWVEVKGCTLARDGIALFPDAPTTRGVRHVEELVSLRSRGFRAAMMILVLRTDALCFAPNGLTDPLFEAAFSRAVSAGVEVYPVLCSCSGQGEICYEHKLEPCKGRGS